MKNKIQKFSKGDFRVKSPEVVFEETNLVLIIGEGEVYRGSFLIKSNNDSAIRGLVYPSSFRVRFKDQGFDGNPARVEFTYDGRGLPPGHVEEGKFTVVCSGGEYELSFTAIIEKPYVMTTYGKVQNTDDFRKLAIKDFSEAGRLFRSRAFYDILKYENERIFYLYDNMRKWSLGEQALEEFLVGIKQKECIFLTLPGEGIGLGVCDQLMVFKDEEAGDARTAAITKFFDAFYEVETYSDYMVYEGFLPATLSASDNLAANAENYIVGGTEDKTGSSEYFATFCATLPTCSFYPMQKAEWMDVRNGVIDVEQQVCSGTTTAQEALDALQASVTE